MLSPEAPFPAIGGGALRTASLLHWLSKRYALDVVVFREPGADDPSHAFPSDLVRSVSVIDLPLHRKDTWARASRNLHRYVRGAPPLVDRFSRFDDAITAALDPVGYELGVIEHFWCARYERVLRPACNRVVLNLHNIESVLLERLSKTEGWPASLMLRRFSNACRRLEHQLLPNFSQLLTTSPEDRAYTSSIAPLVHTCVYPNAIPAVSRPQSEKSDVIVFSGNLDYEPNRGALTWFRNCVWPELSSKWPELRWRIIGRNHEWVRNEFAGDPRIDVTGPVDDAILELSYARAAVVPIIAGSGTRIKIIEAWAAGTPVISTRLGAEGLPGVAGEHLLLADEPDTFVRAISSIFEFPALGERLAKQGRSLFEKELTWTAAWKCLDQCGL